MGKIANCNKVHLRMECQECGYPYSEAMLSDDGSVHYDLVEQENKWLESTDGGIDIGLVDDDAYLIEGEHEAGFCLECESSPCECVTLPEDVDTTVF